MYIYIYTYCMYTVSGVWAGFYPLRNWVTSWGAPRWQVRTAPLRFPMDISIFWLVISQVLGKDIMG